MQVVFICEDCHAKQNLNHKRLLVTDLIFCNNPKADGKILLGTRVMLTLGLAYKMTSVTASQTLNLFIAFAYSNSLIL